MSLLVDTNTERFQNWNSETPPLTHVGQKRKRLTKYGQKCDKRRKIAATELNVDFLNCCYDPIVANVVQRLDASSLLSLGCTSKLWRIVTTACHDLWSSLVFPMRPSFNAEKRFCVAMRKEVSRDVVIPGDFIHASFLRTRAKLMVVSICNGEVVADLVPLVAGEGNHITFVLPGIDARGETIVSACISEDELFMALLRHNGEMIVVNLSNGKLKVVPTRIRLFNSSKLPMFFHRSKLVIVEHNEDSNVIRFFTSDCLNEEATLTESVLTTNVPLAAVTCRSDDDSTMIGAACIRGSSNILLFSAIDNGDGLTIRHNIVSPKFPVEAPDFFTDRLSKIAITQTNLYCVCIFGAPMWFDNNLQLSERIACPYFEKSSINAVALNQPQVFSDCLMTIDKLTKVYSPRAENVFDINTLGYPSKAPKHSYRENHYYDNVGVNGRVISVLPDSNKKQTTVRLRTFF